VDRPRAGGTRSRDRWLIPSAVSAAEPSPTAARRTTVPWPLPLAALVVAGLLVAYPPFRLSSQKAAAAGAAREAAGAFDAAAFVAEFWTARLQPAAAAAPDLAPLLADLRRDPGAAVERHGRRVGLGNAAYYFARGTGRVAAVERSRLLVELDGAVVAVRTGPVFGNVVRDGCGLLEVNQAPGLAEFNALSAELNRLVEERVQPALKAGVAVGATLTFSGCAEAPETLPAPGAPLLTFIPLQVEVKP
jgi:predicted lipoprotein